MLAALVLCGGSSTRMGQDKGLIKSNHSRWVALSVGLLEKTGLPVYVSIRAAQEAAYKQILPGHTLLIDSGELAVKGPALGILTAHEQLPSHDLLVLACDMQDINLSLVERLMDGYAKNKGADSFIYSYNNEPEPLFGIYSKESLTTLYRLATTGRLEKFSMKYMLGCINPTYLPVSAQEFPFFKNYNSPAD